MIYIIIYYAGAGSTKNRKTKNSITRKGNTSTFTYDAAGKKLAHFDGKLVKTTNYCSNFVYENGSLAYIISLEGRILRNTNGSYTYEYFLKDHLGNTRVTFQDNGTVVQTA
ncbi:MAG: hypothetical protein JXB34_11560, partial [Bacteroidales bacterium]|nr:hypothetical protein [Bacteroidales bacterium]